MTSIQERIERIQDALADPQNRYLQTIFGHIDNVSASRLRGIFNNGESSFPDSVVQEYYEINWQVYQRLYIRMYPDTSIITIIGSARYRISFKEEISDIIESLDTGEFMALIRHFIPADLIFLRRSDREAWLQFWRANFTYIIEQAELDTDDLEDIENHKIEVVLRDLPNDNDTDQEDDATRIEILRKIFNYMEEISVNYQILDDDNKRIIRQTYGNLPNQMKTTPFRDQFRQIMGRYS